LADLSAIKLGGDCVALALPAVSWADWSPLVEQTEALSDRIAEALADSADELRSRILRCSFAQGSFADAVMVAITLTAALVCEAVMDRGWLTFPAQAAFEWGCLLVC